MQICVLMEEQEERLFIWVSAYKCVFKTSLDSMHQPRKNIEICSNVSLSMWLGRQMGINFVSKSYFALAGYTKRDIKPRRGSC